MSITTSGSTQDLFIQLVNIVSKLRKECPWDMAQTHESLRPLLIEEAYEAVEAIDRRDFSELNKELGDLLLHIIFHADLASEAGTFTLSTVIQSECEKLVYRHPHVFGDVKVTGAEEVSYNWEQLKRREPGRTSVLDGVPLTLPSLQRAGRIQEKAAKVGFDWENHQDVLIKVQEELGEFLAETDRIKKQEEFGDLLFSLVNYSRHIGIEPETALREAVKKFERRFRQVEIRAESSGRAVHDHDLEELDTLWNLVKLEEG